MYIQVQLVWHTLHSDEHLSWGSHEEFVCSCEIFSDTVVLKLEQHILVKSNTDMRLCTLSAHA